MKKVLYLFLMVSMAFLVNACNSEDTTGPETGSTTGSIFVRSTPSGAQIWMGSTNTGKVTPDSVTNLQAGSHSITLKLAGYPDTTFTVTVTGGQVSNVNVQLPLALQAFGPVKLWETIGTSATQPSGLILSTGAASGIGSTATDRLKVDLYYSSNGFVIASADQATGLSRKTYFKVGGSTNLTDSVDTQAKDASWTSSFKDIENNYVFVVDNDNHYSKLQIVSRGGGTPGNPAWVEVKWIYNKSAGDLRF